MADSGTTSDIQQAYFAMIEYLEAYWKRDNSDEIAGMLSGMLLLKVGSSMDPAVWEDRKAAWERAKNKTHDLGSLRKRQVSAWALNRRNWSSQ